VSTIETSMYKKLDESRIKQPLDCDTVTAAFFNGNNISYIQKVRILIAPSEKTKIKRRRRQRLGLGRLNPLGRHPIQAEQIDKGLPERPLAELHDTFLAKAVGRCLGSQRHGLSPGQSAKRTTRTL